MKKKETWYQKTEYGILIVYFLVMTWIYPFYYTEGYLLIGKDKYLFYRNCSLLILSVLLIVWAVSLITGRAGKGQSVFVTLYEQMSATDWFVYGYLLVNLVSYLGTKYQEEAFWGTEGWYMGMMTQLLLGLFYFFFSRSFHSCEKWFVLWLPGALTVFLLGIMNRYSFYPLSMEGQTPAFISTLGNINWYSGYWSVVCPLAVMLYWNSHPIWKKAVWAVACVICFAAGVTQGSSSAFLVLGGIGYVLFYLAFTDNRGCYASLELGVLFSISCQITRILRYVPGFSYNYESVTGEIMTDFRVTVGMAVVCVLLWIFLKVAEKKKAFAIEEKRKIRTVCSVAGILMIVCYLFLMFKKMDASFGNGRGASWKSGILAFQSMNLWQKLFGIGADCYGTYCYSVPEIKEVLFVTFGASRLTNAHNEWLTMLVNLGLFGFFSYAGIFVSAVYRFAKGSRKNPLLLLCAVGVFSYVLHNMVSFQQILNMPYVFMLLGMGEELLRQERKSSE